jgi:phosphopantothenoylcysteine synthetase/decarboxylase
VRVISNIAAGETGILLAKRLAALGAKVTLLLGPAGSCCLPQAIRLLRFRYFEELKKTLLQELSAGKYDILIHSAAVADYKVEKAFGRKISSARKAWVLKLVPTEKIINLVRGIGPGITLVGFKFQPQVKKALLIKKARELLKAARADLIVANTLNRSKYEAYLVHKDSVCGPVFGKKNLVEKLVGAIGECRWPD